MFAVISIAVLTAVLFSILGLINGIYAKRFDDVSIVPTFVLTPLTYLGGVFFSIELLPSFGQVLLSSIQFCMWSMRFASGFWGYRIFHWFGRMES